MSDEYLKQEITDTGKSLGMPRWSWGMYCQSGKDGDCSWKNCPQTRDGEPANSGRHCPLDIHQEERGYQ